jgi:polysaccharide export outer membrane protein
MKYNFLCLALLLFIGSCNSSKNLAYFGDMEEQGLYKEKITNSSVPRIQPDDILSISISSLNPEANAMFNREAASYTSISSRSNVSSNYSRSGDEGYLVDNEGFVDFPVLGKVKLAGLTKQEAKTLLYRELQDYLKEPTVNIRFLNFRVTVIGEVKNPATFTIPSEKVNILEALGMAGDMTAFGRRENVLLIREEGGVRTMTRLNLKSIETLKSPFFYLQQNDVVYVEPNKVKNTQSTIDTRYISLAFGAVSTLTLLIWRLF